MGRNLSNLYISESFQYLTQISGSELQTGLGSTITSVNVTASNAVSSSYSNTSTSASYALVSTTSSFAINATSASYANNSTSASFAVTASFALNAGATVSTASLLTTASAVNNVITFTKGDGSTFPITVNTGSAVTVNTGSLLTTASFSDAQITFTKGDGSTFSGVINNVTSSISASFATTAISSSFATNSNTATSASFATSASQAQNSVSASFATTASFVASVVSASYALSASQAQNANTASFALNIANNLSPTFANVTASNALITGTASIAFLNVTIESSSVIYSSGSNQFGDASNDVQTLYGTVNILTGPLNVSGSANFYNGITGSLQGTASFANNATSASFATSATSASFASTSTSASFATSASQAQNATSASFANTSTSASFATNATSASFAISASQAQSTTQVDIVNAQTGMVPGAGTKFFALVDSTGNQTVYRNPDTKFNSGFPALQLSSSVSFVAAKSFYGPNGPGDDAIFRGILQGTAETASFTPNALVTASVSSNVLTFTKGDGSAFNLTVNTGSGGGGSAFPFTGSAVITGSLTVTGSIVTGLNNSINNNNGQQSIVGSELSVINSSTGTSLTILGGYSNDITGNGSKLTIVGGRDNTISSNHDVATIMGCINSTIQGTGTYDALLLNALSTNLTANNNNNTVINGFGSNATINGSNILHIPIDFQSTTINSQNSIIKGSGIYGGSNIFVFNPQNNEAQSMGNLSDSVIFNHYPKWGGPDVSSAYTALINNVDSPISLALQYSMVAGNNKATIEYNGTNRVHNHALILANKNFYLSGSTTDNDTLSLYALNNGISGSNNIRTVVLGQSGSISVANLTGSVILPNSSNKTYSDNYTLYGENAVFRGSVVVTGSVRGNVSGLTISSNTASIDLSVANFFTLSLVSGSVTHVNPTNINPGQTINLQLIQPAVGYGNITYPTSIKTQNGQQITPTLTSSAVDVVSLVTFDTSSLYATSVKNLQ